MTERSVPLTTEALNFMAYMPTGNDLVLVVLKGHLLIEQLLTQIIESVVAHGDLLENVRFAFAQKQSLARAMCWSQHTNPMWDFIEALNTMRNDAVHSLGNKKTDAKFQKLLDAHEATLDAEQLKEITGLSTADRLRHAIMHTMGFLAQYAGDAQLYRMMVDEMQPRLKPVKP